MASTEALTIDIAKIELGNPNEVETVQTPASSRSEEDRVLIEKDGKFELMKADDIQASPLDSIITPSESSTATQPNHLQTESKTTNKTTPRGRNTPSGSGGNSVTSRLTDSGRKLVSRTPIPAQGLGTGSSSSLLQPRRRTRPSTQPFPPGDSPRRDVRPQTAPLGPKSNSYFSLKGAERRELADEAFEAWLDLKDKQLSESVKNRAGIANPGGGPERQKRTVDAYRAWMDSKKTQVLGEMEANKRIQITSTTHKTSDSVTFERWLKEKSQFRKTRKGPKVTLTSFGEQK